MSYERLAFGLLRAPFVQAEAFGNTALSADPGLRTSGDERRSVRQ